MFKRPKAGREPGAHIELQQITEGSPWEEFPFGTANGIPSDTRSFDCARLRLASLRMTSFAGRPQPTCLTASRSCAPPDRRGRLSPRELGWLTRQGTCGTNYKLRASFPGRRRSSL